jgi:hypothetical protein
MSQCYLNRAPVDRFCTDKAIEAHKKRIKKFLDDAKDFGLIVDKLSEGHRK